MITPFVWPWGLDSGGGSNPATTPVEYDFTPTEGEVVQVPATPALLVSILLWNAAPLNAVELRLPDGVVRGQRFFIFQSDSSIAQLTVTGSPGVRIANGVASLNENDLIVFSTVSEDHQVIGRVATS